MPIYEYGCTSCREVFESLKRLSEEKDEEKCPKCGAKARKLGISLFRSRSTGQGSGSGSCGPAGGSSPFR